MTKSREIPCSCGFTYELNPEEFEIYALKLCKDREGFQSPKMRVPRCIKCKTLSLIENSCYNCHLFKDDPRSENQSCEVCG